MLTDKKEMDGILGSIGVHNMKSAKTRTLTKIISEVGTI